LFGLQTAYVDGRWAHVAITAAITRAVETTTITKGKMNNGYTEVDGDHVAKNKRDYAD